MSPSWEDVEGEALAIIQEAGKQGVTLRVVGSAGIRMHCVGPASVMDLLGRPAKDIDFVVPQEHRKGMRRVLETRGYVVDRDLLVAMEGSRFSFQHSATGVELDVFVDKLEFCHTVEIRSRLQQHQVTLPIEELLLQKLQIVSMTVTDMLDVGVVFATHDVGRGQTDPEAIDAVHIARILASDWGFHHTAARNLLRLRESVGTQAGIDLGDLSNAKVQRGIEGLQQAIEEHPKSLGWKVRAKVGERVQWWNDVNEREATY